MELARLLGNLFKVPAMVSHHYRAMRYFHAGKYAKALHHYAKLEQILLSTASALSPKEMLEKALCHQALEQDADAVAYMNLIWQWIRDSRSLNTDEKAYLFTYMILRAQPYLLTVSEFPPGYDTFNLERVGAKLRRRYPIPEVEESENAPP